MNAGRRRYRFAVILRHTLKIVTGRTRWLLLGSMLTLLLLYHLGLPAKRAEHGMSEVRRHAHYTSKSGRDERERTLGVDDGMLCPLPKFDPWDESILPYVTRNVSRLTCKRVQPDLTYLAEGRLYINATEYAFSLRANTTKNGRGRDRHHITCFYRCYTRKEGSDLELRFTEWARLKNGTAITEFEFVEVACYNGKHSSGQNSKNYTAIYTNNHAQLLPIPDGHKMENANARISPPEEVHFDAAIRLNRTNVVLFVIDSVSNLHWHRHLPKTLRVLETDYSPLFEFKGMTTVGDNSFPNAVAFLTGRNPYPKLDEGEVQELPGNLSTDHFDNWPFVWKEYAKQGYATFYAADETQWELFNYYYNGFVEQPTDHALMPYYLRLYESELFKKHSSYKCYGNRPMYAPQLDYLGQLFRAYAGRRPVFALNWISEMSHDYLNDLGMADDDFAHFFRANHHYLKDSFLFVFGDHGHRFDDILQTVVGRVEKRMPFFSMHLPQRLTKDGRYRELVEAIRGNLDRLTTLYDLHITLRDILRLESEIRADPKTWKAPLGQEVDLYRREYAPHGLSLLRPLPHRDCAAAGVPLQFCTCLQERATNTNDTSVVEAGEAVVESLNQLLLAAEPRAGKRCSQLGLKGVSSASFSILDLRASNGTSTSNEPLHNYRLVVETSPNSGLFEALVQRSSGIAQFRVVGYPSRINVYGNQSACVDDARYRPYCYCI